MTLSCPCCSRQARTSRQDESQNLMLALRGIKILIPLASATAKLAHKEEAPALS